MATQTIVITNFGGRLTRVLNGDLNSGFAKFTNSFGYDPFSKPMNLTWLETPTSITGFTGVPLTGKVLSDPNNGPNVHIISSGAWYQIKSSTYANPNLNSIVGQYSVITGDTFQRGGSMEFYGSVVGTDLAGNSLGKLYLGSDNIVQSINPDGSGRATVGNSSYYTGNIYHPLKPFIGNLIFGNGPTIGMINNTGTVVSSVLNVGTGNIYSQLNPALGTQTKVMSIEVSPSNDYLTLTSANIAQEELISDPQSDTAHTFGSQDGKLYLWNGTDQTVTAATSLPSYLVTAIKTYFQNTAFFSNDTFGATFNNGTDKIFSLPANKTPLPDAISINGNFMTWACPETDATNRYMSLYYFGSLDQENPTGLYRLLRWKTLQTNGYVVNVPLNLIVSNNYSTLNSTSPSSIITLSYGKHYVGLLSENTGSTKVNYILSFLVTSTGTGTPQLGVYETQTQLFSQEMTILQVRFYVEPTVAGNKFQFDMIDSDGSIIPNGTYTYTFGDTTDVRSGSSAVQRIGFNPNATTRYALGVRITNLGTTNMTFKKIEIDYDEDGK